MAITKEEHLNRIDINVQNPHIEIIKRVSFYEDGVEITREHTETLYTMKNQHEIASQSQFVQGIWAYVSSSFVEASGSIQ
jgi:hypothetical protein